MNKFGQKIFEDRYAAYPGETWEAASERIADFVFPAEEELRKATEKAIKNREFIPAGRILKSAGAERNLTGYNCYVLPSPEDSREGIVKTLGEMIEIMSHGGGVGINLASLRPRDAKVEGVDGTSSGAVSWGSLYSQATGLIIQGGSRRGALMLTLPIWHPDIIEFINCKKTPGMMENANLSVMVTDDFMEAVEKNNLWKLQFPDTAWEEYKEWTGSDTYNGLWKTYRELPARELWEMITQSAWESAEPGVLFWDEIKRDFAGKGYSEPVCVNPCAEQPLPAYGVCNLGHINLAEFVHEDGHVDWKKLDYTVTIGVSFLDTLIDLTNPVLHEVRQNQLQERRIGLGVMGFHDLLLKLGIQYGSEKSLEALEKILKRMFIQAALISSHRAKILGEPRTFKLEVFKKTKLYQLLKEEKQEYILNQIYMYGLRNTSLLSIAPTGTIGTMLDVSTGIEPYFSFAPYERTSRLGKETVVPSIVEELEGSDPDLFVSAYDLTPEQHLSVVEVAQTFVDSSISKTINMPAESTVEDVDKLFRTAYNTGVKGITIYRDGSRQEQILSVKTCENCGGQMQQQEGCYTCTSCGSSYCSV